MNNIITLISLKKRQCELKIINADKMLEKGYRCVLQDSVKNKLLEGRWQENQTIIFTINNKNSELGRYTPVWIKGQETIIIYPEEQVYNEMTLDSFYYDEDWDLMLRAVKNPENILCIYISRARKFPKFAINTLDVESLEVQHRNLILNLASSLNDVDDAEIIMIPNKGDHIWKKKIVVGKTITVNLEEFVEYLKNIWHGKWKVYIQVLKNGEYKVYRPYKEKVIEELEKEEAIYNQRFRFANPMDLFEKEEISYKMLVGFTEEGKLSLSIVKNSNWISKFITNKVLEFKISKNILYISVEAADVNMDIKGLQIELRTTKEDEKEVGLYPIEVKKRKKKKLLITAQCDLSKLHLRPLNWDIFLVYEKDGMEYPTRLTNREKNFKKKHFMKFFSTNTIKVGKDFIFYPYMTISEHLAFQCREKMKYDNYWFKIKERIAALVYYIGKSYWQNKKIHLVYEKFCTMAQDNGYYYFKYCMENNIEEKIDRSIYYVIDKKAPDYANVKQYKGHVVSFMSIRYMVYLLASKLLICTETRDHAYAWRVKDSIITQYLDSKKLVFLQHGVIALKVVDAFSKGKRGGCSLFITSNDMERSIIYNYFGYRNREIAVTGLARWDVLEDRSEGKREILVMPSWRNWLDEVGDEIFVQSDYYKYYMEFLNSNELENLLEQYDMKLNFYLHPKFRQYIGNFSTKGGRIELIAFGEAPLNELLMRCKMLITDYSSVCWDVFYQSKPVIFYQFDLEQYEIAHGSYIDMETELFGDRALNTVELFKLMEEYIQTNFELKPEYKKMHPYCYKYIDSDNSKRICEEIEKRKW